MEKIEIFKNNLEDADFTDGFIKQALQYFNELIEEKMILEVDNLEDLLNYYNKVGSFTCNASQSYFNLCNFREDLYKLYQYDANNSMDFKDYFCDIEDFELQVLCTLFYEFYPQEEEEEIN